MKLFLFRINASSQNVKNRYTFLCQSCACVVSLLEDRRLRYAHMVTTYRKEIEKAGASFI
jgi:hypothetical protein